ncbi:hypothetical protein BLNAU_6843 [Blattamonas nauphoetae]|uniref:Uncharacterized protein n=1 Tax=Blattamonas nauphoetae TaxID=2049346 RepID=A0ABQ9Y333_9EUKA|nr:hypothetical protein BLNAU_6843 [Blattamonas nauphoetae]
MSSESESMTVIDAKIDASTAYQCPDNSTFLNWDCNGCDSEHERTVIFQSLVATVKLHPALDESLEAKAVKFLEYAVPNNSEAAEALVDNFASFSGDSSPDFAQSITVLISSPSRAITTASMKILDSLCVWCSPKVQFILLQTDLISKLINTLNPQSLSFTEKVDIHKSLLKTITNSLWLSTPRGLAQLGIEDGDEQQSVYEIVLKQVLIPSEKYICHLCVNRFSIVDEDQSRYFLEILARFLQISFWISLAHQLTLRRRIERIERTRRPIHCRPRSILHRHPRPFTPVCLPLITHTLPLPSASPLTAHALQLPSASPLPTLVVTHADGCLFDAQAMLTSTVFLLRFL